jgi:hypothetical protein
MQAVVEQSEPKPIEAPVWTEEQVRSNARSWEIRRAVLIAVAILLVIGGVGTGLYTDRATVSLALLLPGLLLGLVCYMNYSGQPNEWLILEPHDCTELLELSEKVPRADTYIKAVQNQNRPFIRADLINMRGNARAWDIWLDGSTDRASCRRLYGLDGGDSAVEGGTEGNAALAAAADRLEAIQRS